MVSRKGIKKCISSAMAAAMILSLNTLNMSTIYAFAEESTSVSSDGAESDTYAFPEALPNADMPDNLTDGAYSVPVYMYARYTDEASMGNGAIDHEATIIVENGTATVHLKFHDMPFLDAYGHLEIFYYYDTDGNKIEAVVDSSEWLVNEDTMDRVKTIRECSFVLPTTEPEIICRVKVDAMGDTEQDARLLFDYNNIVFLSAAVDTAALESKIAEAETISNSDGKYTEDSYAALRQMVTLAKNALTAEDLTQEYADQFVGLLQNAIDGLAEVQNPSADVDTAALESKIAEAETISNSDGKYTEDSYAALRQMVTLAKNALTAEDLTQEYADQFAGLLQNAIDGLAEVQNPSADVDTAKLKKLIAYAKTFNNDDGGYTQESFSALQDEIKKAEELCGSITTLDEMNDIQYDLASAVSDLESYADLDFEDGYYETSVSFYGAYYDHDLNLYVLKDGTAEYDLMKNALGSTVQFKVEEGIYTVMFMPQICEDDSWYYSYFSTGGLLSGSAGAEGNIVNQTVEYYGREINIIDPDGYILPREMNHPYTYKTANYISIAGYSKSNEMKWAENITQVKYDDGTLPYFEVALINIDWENAVKTDEIKIDKSELASQIEFAEYMFTTDLSIYTDASVSAYKDAYESAKAIYEDENVKQSDVKKAAQALSDASYNLVKNSAYLNAKILEASAIDKGDSSDEKWNALQDAISDAQNVMNNENASQEELKEQIAKLSNAIETFSSSAVNTSALEAKIAEAQGISNDGGRYTEESFAALQQMITLAKNSLTAEDLTQEYADQFVILLQNAIDSLEESGISSNVDTSALELKIAEAQAISNDDGKYTENSYNALQEMIVLAENAVTAPDLTQEYADQFVTLLQNSIDELEENLPQTGNNSWFNFLAVAGAITLTAAGLAAIAKSGVVRKKQ